MNDLRTKPLPSLALKLPYPRTLVADRLLQALPGERALPCQGAAALDRGELPELVELGLQPRDALLAGNNVSLALLQQHALAGGGGIGEFERAGLLAEPSTSAGRLGVRLLLLAVATQRGGRDAPHGALDARRMLGFTPLARASCVPAG